MRCVLLVALMCVAEAAMADDDAIRENKREARAHFRAGTAFYDAGVYDKAIAEYENAYRLVSLPDMLFNIGQAYRLKGDARKALTYYQSYIAAKSTGPVSDQARAHIRELTGKVLPPPDAQPPTTPPEPLLAPAGHEPPAAETPAASTTMPQEPEVAPSVSAPTSPAAGPTELTPVPAPPLAPTSATEPSAASPARRARSRKWMWGLVAGGAVVLVGAAVGVGLGVAVHAQNPSPSFGMAVVR
jgi:iron complex outermembrane receptor protein